MKTYKINTMLKENGNAFHQIKLNVYDPGYRTLSINGLRCRVPFPYLALYEFNDKRGKPYGMRGGLSLIEPTPTTREYYAIPLPNCYDDGSVCACGSIDAFFRSDFYGYEYPGSQLAELVFGGVLRLEKYTPGQFAEKVKETASWPRFTPFWHRHDVDYTMET